MQRRHSVAAKIAAALCVVEHSVDRKIGKRLVGRSVQCKPWGNYDMPIICSRVHDSIPFLSLHLPEQTNRSSTVKIHDGKNGTVLYSDNVLVENTNPRHENYTAHK
jgi:hypothetical protein